MISFIQTHITPVFTFLTLVSHIVYIVGFALLLTHGAFRRLVYSFVHKHIVWLLFVGSLVAVVGSLSYSEIVGYLPCDLCWWQRICMYPQIILTLIAGIRKDKGIVLYTLGLSIIGAIISLFHSFIHWGFHSSFLSCTAVAAPCAKVYVLMYGYITIPFMAFTVFAYLITISVIYLKSLK